MLNLVFESQLLMSNSNEYEYHHLYSYDRCKVPCQERKTCLKSLNAEFELEMGMGIETTTRLTKICRK